MQKAKTERIDRKYGKLNNSWRFKYHTFDKRQNKLVDHKEHKNFTKTINEI